MLQICVPKYLPPRVLTAWRNASTQIKCTKLRQYKKEHREAIQISLQKSKLVHCHALGVNSIHVMKIAKHRKISCGSAPLISTVQIQKIISITWWFSCLISSQNEIAIQLRQLLELLASTTYLTHRIRLAIGALFIMRRTGLKRMKIALFECIAHLHRSLNYLDQHLRRACTGINGTFPSNHWFRWNLNPKQPLFYHRFSRWASPWVSKNWLNLNCTDWIRYLLFPISLKLRCSSNTTAKPQIAVGGFGVKSNPRINEISTKLNTRKMKLQLRELSKIKSARIWIPPSEPIEPTIRVKY